MAHTFLSAWESFYVIVGSAAAALTGLQFVVIALINEGPKGRSTREIDAWGTPTIVHFSMVLLISAILSAPWHGLTSVALMLAACGLAGGIYCFIVLRRARSQTGYDPVLEDWIWYAVLPVTSYVTVLIASLFLTHYPERALFAVAAATLGFLFTGIHNAWDTVTYIAIGQWEEGEKKNTEVQGQ